jgi:hypothetical protein
MFYRFIDDVAERYKSFQNKRGIESVNISNDF